MSCPAIKHDRWRTIHACALERPHRVHQTADGFLFLDDDAIAISERYVVAWVVYTGENAPELDQVAPLSIARSDWASMTFVPVTVIANGMSRSVFPGEALARFNDGAVDVIKADDIPRYRALEPA